MPPSRSKQISGAWIHKSAIFIKLTTPQKGPDSMSTILLIDDDYAVRLSLRMLLEDEGFTVVEAENGEEGIAKYRDNPTDLVITDLFMPKKEGIETITDLKAAFPDARIVAISGGGKHIPGGFLVFARQMGALHTFEKPIDPETFLQTIHQLLNGAPAAT